MAQQPDIYLQTLKTATRFILEVKSIQAVTKPEIAGVE